MNQKTEVENIYIGKEVGDFVICKAKATLAIDY